MNRLESEPIPTAQLRHAPRHAWVAACAATLFSGAALAHDFRAGEVHIGHPYATPNVPGTSIGAAYIATLENTGAQPDRLLRISTPMAARVELHDMSIDARGVMRMRMLDDIRLAPQAALKMRPGQGLHFMLIELKEPLTEGRTFPMTMEFERGGKVDVKVVVQVPRARAGDAAAHKH